MKSRLKFLALAVFLCGFFLASVKYVQITCEHPLGTSLFERTGVYDGFVLLAPYFSENNFTGGGVVHLLATSGKIAHTWKTKHPVLISYLQPDGNIFAAMTPPITLSDFPSGGSTGLIQELDWDGNVLWEYADREMTHDFEVMPEKKIAYIRWNKAPDSFARNVRGGMAGATTSVWTNELVIVNREKKIEWTWRPEDHLDPSKFIVSPLVPRSDWAHVNSIRYTEINPVTQKPAFLISVRHLSKVMIVEIETGAVVWMTPDNTIALQHDATFTPQNTVLIFDNGLFRNIAKPFLFSGVGEVDPITNTLVWSWSGGKTPVEKAQFNSHFMSGAERLPNGNTFIIASAANTLLEVTKQGDIVWKYTSDWRDEEGRMRIIFKARKYNPTDTVWGKKVSHYTVRSLLCGR